MYINKFIEVVYLTHFCVWKNGITDIPNRYRITTDSYSNFLEYSESFYARLPRAGSCDY